MRNYFELFNLPKSFYLDLELLRECYLNLQQKYHPDQVEDQSLKQQYIQLSSEINQGYQVLKDSLKRAEYLGNLLSPNFVLTTTTKFLEYIWQTLNTVEECSDNLELNELLQKQFSQQNEIIQELNQVFIVQNIIAAQQKVAELKYLTTVINSIKDKIDLIT